MNKRRLILILTAVVLVAAVLIGGTWAYRTGSIETTNVITIGKVKITATEQNPPTSEKIVPGVPFPVRHIEIKNTGSVAAYVRVKVNPTDSAMQDRFPITANSTAQEPWMEWKHPTTGETYFLYKNPIAHGGNVTFTAVTVPSIAITSADVGRNQSWASFRVTVEAVQVDHFAVDPATGFPDWATTTAVPAL